MVKINSFEFYTKNFTLKVPSFEFPLGSCIALMGGVGSGKSTFLECLNNLISPVKKGKSPIINHDVFLVSEKTRPSFSLSIKDFADLLNFSSSHFSSEVFWENMDLGKIATNRNLNQLSQGEKVWVHLVSHMALSENRIILIDENLSSLDPFFKELFFTWIDTAGLDLGISIIFSTHDFSEAESHASHIMWCNKGQISFLGDIDTLKEKKGLPLSQILTYGQERKIEIC